MDTPRPPRRRRSSSSSSRSRAPPPSLPSIADIKSSDTSVVGAVALILGSTVGAGILALPSVTAPAGFAPSAATLVGVWALLTAEACLLAEVNLALWRDKERDGGSGDVVTLREMAAATLGPSGAHFVSFAYLALSYTLMIAYISKAGDLLGGGGAGPPTAFTAAVGAVLAAGPGAVDGVNRVATGALLALYAVIVGAGSLNADWTSLSRADWGAAPAAVPVVLLSLVFHDLVPVVVAQLRGDASKVRTALLVGGGIPLAMFAAWDAVALALADAAAPGADPLAALAAAGGPGLTAAVAGFSGLALATSALGNALGLTSTVAAELEAAGRAASAVESTSASSSDEDEDEAGASLPSPLSAALAAAPPRAAALALVLAPPLAAAIANPGSFVAALNAAGGYGMTALYGLLPPLMAWRLREQQLRATADAGSDDALPSPSALRLPGGRAALAGLTAAAAAVEVGRLAEDVGSSGGGGGMAAAVGDVVASVFGAF